MLLLVEVKGYERSVDDKLKIFKKNNKNCNLGNVSVHGFLQGFFFVANLSSQT